MATSKQTMAEEFLAVAKRLLVDPALSDATRIENILGLLTGDDLGVLLRRDRIREAIQQSLDNTSSFSVTDIAKQCKASEDTVQKVWSAMRDEYPADTSPRAEFKLALPKESRAYQIVEAILAEAGFRIELDDKRLGTGSIIDMKNGLQPIPFQIVRGQDMPIYMKAGLMQAAFVGNDRLREIVSEEERKEVSPLQTDILAIFRENSFRMCFAVPENAQPLAQEEGLKYLNGKRIATSYPETLKAAIREENAEIEKRNAQFGKNDVAVREEMIVPLEIKVLKGGVEQSIVNFGMDVIMDIVETGGSLKKNKLVVLGHPLFTGSMDLFKLAATQLTPKNTGRIEQFRQRLLRGNAVRPQPVGTVTEASQNTAA